MPGIRPPGPIAPRFWKKVDKRGPDECWPWLASFGFRNYGKFKLGKTYVAAHRVAYMLTYDDFNPKLNVCHTCDNPSCCNPKHLFQGTHSDNMTDKVNKNRQAKGADVRPPKLTKEQVVDLRELYAKGVSIKELCRLFDLERHLVSRAVHGKGVYDA